MAFALPRQPARPAVVPFGFWALPAVQKQHIGMQVLRKVWEEGRQRGATTYFVWASSDLPAMAAYMKMGMLPGTQILTFEGTPSVKRPRLRRTQHSRSTSPWRWGWIR